MLQRVDIMKAVLRDTPHELSHEQLELLVARCHGYVGADLAALCREAGLKTVASIDSQDSVCGMLALHRDDK